MGSTSSSEESETASSEESETSSSEESETSGRLENATNLLRNAPGITGITGDTYQVGKAINTDSNMSLAADDVGGIVSGYGGGAIEALFDGVGAVPGAIIGDTYKVAKAIYTDCTKTKKKRPRKRTVRAVASVAGGRTAAVAGSTAGAYVGGATGALFGGAGAVLRAVIGGAVGAAEAAVKECVSSDSEDSN